MHVQAKIMRFFKALNSFRDASAELAEAAAEIQFEATQISGQELVDLVDAIAKSPNPNNPVEGAIARQLNQN